jgi:molecular chaperone HscB
MNDSVTANDLFSKNYFEIFALDVAFDVDAGTVAERHRELQKQYHPDRFASADEAQRRLAVQQTALLNQAFQTLSDPLLRAQYLLALKGVDMNNDTDTSMDGAFLMAQMELREAIADVRGRDDPLAALDELMKESKQNIQQYMDEFARLYATEDLASARDSVRKLQFLFKAQQEITALLEQIEDELL